MRAAFWTPTPRIPTISRHCAARQSSGHPARPDRAPAVRLGLPRPRARGRARRRRSRRPRAPGADGHAGDRHPHRRPVSWQARRRDGLRRSHPGPLRGRGHSHPPPDLRRPRTLRRRPRRVRVLVPERRGVRPPDQRRRLHHGARQGALRLRLAQVGQRGARHRRRDAPGGAHPALLHGRDRGDRGRVRDLRRRAWLHRAGLQDALDRVPREGRLPGEHGRLAAGQALLRHPREEPPHRGAVGVGGLRRRRAQVALGRHPADLRARRLHPRRF